MNKKTYRNNPYFIKVVNAVVNAVVRFLSIFIKIDKNLILIGSAFNGFTDNSKYFYLYIIKHYPNKNIVWVTKDIKLLNELKNKNLPVVYKWSLECFYLILKTKYIFITHIISDVYPWIRKDSIVVNLWHGFGLKKMGFDSKTEQKWLYFKEKYNLPIPYKRWDYITLQTALHIPFYKSSMHLSDSQLLISGVPKNDILYEYKKNPKNYQSLIIELKNMFNIKEQKVILYAPTWRDDPNDKTLLNLLNNRIFLNYLENNNYKLLMKFHPGVILDLNDNLSEVLVNVSLYPDIQELYLVSDILMSDYSSTIFDFSILQKPIILYAYDLENYSFTRGGFYFEYDEIFRDFAICRNLDSIMEKLINIDKYKSNDFYKNYNIENASANIVKELKIEKN